jgi:putative CocE/NonD family hydrolase
VLLGALALVLAVPSPAAARDLSPKSLEPGPDEYPKVFRQADVPITMRDGVKLYADVYRPADASGKPVRGRFPVVLDQILFNKNGASVDGTTLGDGTPYANLEEQASGFKPLFVKHGYVQVIVDVRGTGSSEGVWSQFGPPEHRDGWDVARWLVKQPFSDGRFVGYGASCMAVGQLFLGAQRPPGLKALFPIVPMDDPYRDVMWHGGALDAPFLAVWHGMVDSTRVIPPEFIINDPAQAAETAQVAGDRLSPQSVSASETLSHPYDSQYYWDRSPGRVAGKVNVPTFVVGGWFDLLQRGAPRVYNALRLPPARKKLLVGPWYHFTIGQGLGEPGTPPRVDALALAWFDRWVNGKRNGIARYAPVTVDQLGPERWQVYRHYPRRDVKYKRFYLNGDQSGSTLWMNDGSLTTKAPASGGSDALPGNSVNGVCTRSTVQWSVSAVPPGQPCETDNRTQDATSLTYTSAPLTSPLHLSGPLSLTLNGSTTARDSTWIATVEAVAPGGKASQITAGWLIQSRRALDVTRTTFAPNGDPIVPYHPFTQESVLPVAPGRKDAMAIEIFNTDAVIEPGYSLRVTISSGDVPHILAPPDSTVASVGAVNTVYRGPGSQSYLTAGVAPLGSERRR